MKAVSMRPARPARAKSKRATSPAVESLRRVIPTWYTDQDLLGGIYGGAVTSLAFLSELLDRRDLRKRKPR